MPNAIVSAKIFDETPDAEVITPPISTLLLFKNGVFTTNFLISSTAIITSEKCEGQDCYKFRNIFNLYNGDTYYINKNNGLSVKNINNDFTVIREYKFDCVEDSIFTEPDISEYEVRENN